jgi:hypothetical protein
MRTALLIPDGVGVRNFLIGRFLRELAEAGPAHAFHIVPERLLPLFAEGLDGRVTWHPLIRYRQSRLLLAMQYSLGYAQMYWADTLAMQRIRSRRPRGSWQKKLLTYTTRAAGRLLATPARMRAMDRLHCRAAAATPEARHYRETFARLRPQVVFSSNQRPSVVLPAVLAARDLNIPTATFIFSWDNLSSKGRIAAPFDYYLVWSEHMRKELLGFYPDVRPERVRVVGTPQFEPYCDSRLLWSREEFCAHVGADPARPLICYSGGDAGTCPEDPEHVRALMELVRDGRIEGRPQVIVRPVPVDDGRRYQAVCHDFPELIFRKPEWIREPGDWTRVIPTPADVEFLANLTAHCDLNINLGSTMTLDFGLHDRPVVNIAFDIADPPVFGQPVWDYYYRFEHYRPVIELGAARFARSREELAEHVNAYLRDPSLDREGRCRLAELQVGAPLGQSCARIIAALREIAGA